MKYLSLLGLMASSSIAFAQTSPTAAPAPSAVAATAAPAPAAPAACTDGEHHQFDFWIGRWDVFNAAGRLVSHSLIESVYGCGIRENWMPLNGQNGGSLSIYVPADHDWEQFWIDSSGSRVVFKGGWNGTAMVISGVWPASPAAAQGPIVRMTYTVQADGSVRQFGESSRDNGQTWAGAFNFVYRRHAA
jgi:hypothetical protein